MMPGRNMASRTSRSSTGLPPEGLGGWPGLDIPRRCGDLYWIGLALPADASQGSRRGPVSERVTTRNYRVARERKPAGRRAKRGDTVGQRRLPSDLAKVGVAGSNPVVRSNLSSAPTSQYFVVNPTRHGTTLGR